jgi:predicted dehydrogenase
LDLCSNSAKELGRKSIMEINSAAVIGTGFIGTVHVEAIRRAGVKVKGVLSSSPESTSAAVAKLGVSQGYGSVEDICNDPDITVVHVTSPNALHVEHVEALIAANKHVVCEKPLALTAAEGRHLLALARKAEVVHALCFNTRFYPMVHEAKNYLQQGLIGEVRYINARYHQDWLLLESDWNWRLESEKAGDLRAVADIGSHLIDQIGFVTGLEVDSVMADLHTLVKTRYRPKGPVQTFTIDTSSEREQVSMRSDDAAGVLLRFTNGARATISISQVSAGEKNTLTWKIGGSTAALSFNSQMPEILNIGHRGQANEVLHKDPAALSKSAAPLAFYPGGHVEGFGETFRGLFERVYADIRGEKFEGTYPTFVDGVRSLQITAAIALSSKNENWTEVTKEKI